MQLKVKNITFAIITCMVIALTSIISYAQPSLNQDIVIFVDSVLKDVTSGGKFESYWCPADMDILLELYSPYEYQILRVYKEPNRPDWEGVVLARIKSATNRGNPIIVDRKIAVSKSNNNYCISWVSPN